MTSTTLMNSETYYHEKQKLGHCAIHSLNNIFQESWVDYDTLSRYASELYNNDLESGVCNYFSCNPYMSTVPYVGFFDISCLIKAIDTRKSKISHHFANSIELDSFDYFSDSIIGLLLNEENPNWWFYSSRHWIGISKLNQSYVNLDSNLTTPIKYENTVDLLALLHETLNKQGHIFVISKSSEAS